jgi:hypothetical protein
MLPYKLQVSSDEMTGTIKTCNKVLLFDSGIVTC